MKKLKGCHFPLEVMMIAVRWYSAYPLSYRHVEDFLKERGIGADHSTVNRWIQKLSVIVKNKFKKYKKPVLGSWRMDETYIRVKGKWVYYYRAVDKEGKTIDVYLSEKRDKEAVRTFFKKAIESSGSPLKVNIDKSGANFFGLKDLNKTLPKDQKIEVTQIKMKQQIIEQDHRFIKKTTNPMLGFKNFESAKATLDLIEINHMIRKNQCSINKNLPTWEQFYTLMR